MTRANYADAEGASTRHSEEQGQGVPLAVLLTQACQTVVDAQIAAVGSGLESAARTLLTCDDEARPQPVMQLAAVAGANRSARHLAQADLAGWPLYSVESARITLHLTVAAPPAPDGVLRARTPATTADGNMTATIHLSTRPGPRPLADDLLAATLTPVPPTIDRDQFPAPARRAIAAWRQLPGLYRRADELTAKAPGHPATPGAVRAVENLAAAVCHWCAGGPPVDPHLIAAAPCPDHLGADAPPALAALAHVVVHLDSALSTEA